MGLDQCQAHKKEGDYVSKGCLGVARKSFKKRERDTRKGRVGSKSATVNGTGLDSKRSGRE